MSQDHTTRICLWSGPRNISTALMYSFAQRPDTTVYDEPLYAWYLKHTKAGEYHPGAEEVLATMENDGNKVVEMMMGEHDRPVVFFKHMTHHLLGLDRGFMKDCVNVILTRDPGQMLPSFDKVIDNPTMGDVGYAAHMELLNDLDKMGIQPIVLEAKKLLMNPEGVLRQLCQRIGTPFAPGMLHWQAGARPEDGSWAKYWYGNVHKSTGFGQYSPKTGSFPPHLEPLLQECLPYYKTLEKLALE
ncbi:sulfotransferase family protein [Roseivirga sp. BDSF3-8]|uniref:sulfotransferase-like domain-containing protein n=1 Tax=Roseivirga sp. BDSF3-8 TaxID=3241598 RepID=UPI003531DA72